MQDQRCVSCGDNTGRCEDDARYVEDEGPLCQECCEELEYQKDLEVMGGT